MKHRALYLRQPSFFILQYNRHVWSPTSKNEIRRIEAVQRRFTKRITGMSSLSYYSRLKELHLESLELRRLLGLLNTSTDVFFTLRAHAHLRGHPYTLDKQRCTSSVSQSFFAIALSICGTTCQATWQTSSVFRALEHGCPTLLFGGPQEQFLKWSRAGLSKSIKHKITFVTVPFYAEQVIS